MPDGEFKNRVLDKDELIRLSVHDVTEEARKRLYKTVYIIGGYAAILLSICTFFAITNVNDAIREIVGTPDNPKPLVRRQIEKQVNKQILATREYIVKKIHSQLGEMFKDIDEEIGRKIDYKVKMIDSRLGEMFADIDEEIGRKIDYEVKMVDSRLGEMFRDSAEETNRIIDYKIRQIKGKTEVISEQEIH